jgi:hypothetical protein
MKKVPIEKMANDFKKAALAGNALSIIFQEMLNNNQVSSKRRKRVGGKRY